MKKEWLEAAAAAMASKDYASFEDLIRAFLEAAAKDGWKLTPREPDQRMQEVGDARVSQGDSAWRIYQGMHDAAPDIPAERIINAADTPHP